MAAEMMRFGQRPKAALLSHSNFGSSNQPSAVKMRKPWFDQEKAPWLEIDGEMHGTRPLDEPYRQQLMPTQPCREKPTCWSARTSTPPTSRTTCSKVAAGNNIALGPVLLGQPNRSAFDPVGHGSTHCEHDRHDGGGRERGALNQPFIKSQTVNPHQKAPAAPYFAPRGAGA